MLKNFRSAIKTLLPGEQVEAHCDAPCGVYDPASARIAAEAVVTLTKKIQALEPPAANNAQAMAAYLNSMARFITIKEEQAEIAKREVLVLWTDYFKPQHLEQHPDLHELVWNTTKLCSKAKQEVNLQAAQDLIEHIHQIHDIFWWTKDRDVPWYTAAL